MTLPLEDLEALLKRPEGEHLEFKEAKNQLDLQTLIKYCAALANEGGGSMVLGVSNRRPREIVGTQAFPNSPKIAGDVGRQLGLKVEAREFDHPKGRVVVFDAPSRPLAVPIRHNDIYWARSGDSTVAMTQDQLKRIFEETEPDFSAKPCLPATLADLDPIAIKRLRGLWIQKSGDRSIQRRSVEQILADAELLVDGKLNHAALVLLGSHAGLGKHLPQAEIVFEYHSSESLFPAQQRIDFRQGFLGFLDELWEAINRRNDLQHFQDGLIMWNIPTFNETVVRESLLNAVYLITALTPRMRRPRAG